MTLNEVAPPTKKHERMVKHIKKSYGKKGGLSDEEKSIAYATAWKNYNKKESFEYEKLKKKIGSKEKHMKPAITEGEYGKLKGWEKGILQSGLKVRSGLSYDKEMARLVKMYPGFKVEEVTLEGVGRFDKLMKAIKGSDLKKDKEVKLMKIAGKVRGIPEEVSRKRKPSAIKKKKKLEKLLIDKEVSKIQKEEMSYKDYQEMIDAGWEMTGEGIWWPPQDTQTISERMSFKSFRGVLDKKKKKEEKKPEKAQDAGAKARRAMKRREHAKYVSGSEDNVPDDLRDHYEVSEGSLHKWFSGSKSKDGKPGWVQSDGSPCANEPGETKTPKCYSSTKRASMSKKELRSADARKSKKDPNQQQKSGAAKPTYVATDKKKKAVDECWKTHKKVGMKKKGGKMVPDCRPKNEEVVTEADKKGKGSGTKDACYHKVKARFKVWPSAYGSGALVKCRKAGAANWGNSKKEEIEYAAYAIEAAAWTRKAGKNKEGGLNEKGRKSYERENPGSDLKAPQPEGGSRKKSFCARMGGMKKKLTSAKTANDPDSRINKALRKWKC